MSQPWGDGGPQPAVRVTGLSKRYDAQSPMALDGIDLVVHAGRFVTVMGPSGSGKSTLLHLIGGLDRPTGGEVEIGGQALSRLDDKGLTLLRRRQVGLVFQAFNLVPVLSVLDNVALPAVIADEKPASYAERAAAAVAAVGLTEHQDKLPSQLSGGQQQRVAVARALFMAPTVMLADEPTGNLDTASGAEILALLRAAVDERGATVVMVSHDPNAAAVGDEVVLIRDGHLAGHIALPAGSAEERAAVVLRFFADPSSAPPPPPLDGAAPSRRPRRAPLSARPRS